MGVVLTGNTPVSKTAQRGFDSRRPCHPLAAVAQQVEQPFRTRQVAGSTPASGPTTTCEAHYGIAK